MTTTIAPGIVPQRLRLLRRRAEWSQKAVAELIGHPSDSTISSIERGERRLLADEVPVLVEAFAEYFATETSAILLYLFGETTDANPGFEPAPRKVGVAA